MSESRVDSAFSGRQGEFKSSLALQLSMGKTRTDFTPRSSINNEGHISYVVNESTTSNGPKEVEEAKPFTPFTKNTMMVFSSPADEPDEIDVENVDL